MVLPSVSVMEIGSGSGSTSSHITPCDRCDTKVEASAFCTTVYLTPAVRCTPFPIRYHPWLAPGLPVPPVFMLTAFNTTASASLFTVMSHPAASTFVEGGQEI